MHDSDLINLCAVLVSILSAISAYISRRAAEKTNKISLHLHQKDIYDAFFKLKMHMAQTAEYAQLEEVTKFYYPAQNAKFYFCKTLTDDITKYFDTCFDIANLARIKKPIDENSQIHFLVKIEENLSIKISKELEKTITLA